MTGTVVLITGIMAAGKSTVAQRLAERLPRSAHVRGDVFRRMVVSGRVDVGPDLADEAVAQLRLRYRLSALVADEYADAGFVAVVQDVALGDDLPAWVSMFRHPPRVVVLAPSAQAVQTREAAREKTGYGDWTVGDLDAGLRGSTPRIGLWLDTSEQTPDQTVDSIVTELAL
jgi:cytidylate kinase